MDRLISEQKAIEAINDYWGEMETPTIDGYINAIKTIPSAEPQTRYWIEKMDACECPYCHKAWDYCDNDTENFDYCPKCGVKLSENPTGSKDIIWYSKRNYSEIMVEPQERSE